MMKNSPKLSTLLAATVLISPIAAHAGLLGGLISKATEGNHSDGPLKIQSGEAIKGTQSVVVGAFNVGFIFQSVDATAATGGLIGAFGGATSAKSELKGVTPEMMQAITDAAYADFRNQMSARGFTVADSATLFASPQFGRAKPETAPFDIKVNLSKGSTEKISYYKPSAFPGLIMLPGDFLAAGFGAMGANMNTGYSQFALADYAKANHQSVVDVTYVIDFSNAKRPGAFSMKGVTVTSGLSVAANSSRLTLINSEGKVGHLVLSELVAVEGDFATMEDATRDKGVQSAMNVLGGLAAVGGMGGLKFGKSRTYEFTVKPGAYEAGAAKATSLASARIVEQLGVLR
jgi:hypothetical protein